jgi:hypothetical protein
LLLAVTGGTKPPLTWMPLPSVVAIAVGAVCPLAA